MGTRTGSIAPVTVVNSPAILRHAFERMSARADVEKVRFGKCHSTATLAHFPKLHDLIGVRIRQGS